MSTIEEDLSEQEYIIGEDDEFNGDTITGGSSDTEQTFEIEDSQDDWNFENKPKPKVKEFQSLSPEELINKQQKEVLDTSEVLGIPISTSGILLRTYNWNKERLFSEFFEDRDAVCKKAKIDVLSETFFVGDKSKIIECSVCMDDKKGDEMISLSCHHFLCKSCWKNYLTVQINDGPSCLHSKCPYPKCKTMVDETLVNEFVDKEGRSKYHKYLARSFVDDNPRIKWCPAPDCGKAVFCPESSLDEVQCSCGNKFCFKCNNESHVPANCEQLFQWRQKEKDESETANWITANTRVCPKCKRSIEKNGGCNHMTCGVCRFEFCWVCNDDWNTHSNTTGGFYKCNKYKPEELDAKNKNLEKDKARQAIEKYMHYYKRYANHNQSQKFEKALREKADERMRELQLKNKYSSWIDVEYIQKGVEHLIECRNSLKYTYVYGYYLEDGPEKNLFEYLQEDLERNTEYLSELLESPIERYDRDLIITTMKSAERRLHHLLSDCRDGLTKNKQ